MWDRREVFHNRSEDRVAHAHLRQPKSEQSHLPHVLVRLENIAPSSEMLTMPDLL